MILPNWITQGSPAIVGITDLDRCRPVPSHNFESQKNITAVWEEKKKEEKETADSVLSISLSFRETGPPKITSTAQRFGVTKKNMPVITNLANKLTNNIISNHPTWKTNWIGYCPRDWVFFKMRENLVCSFFHQCNDAYEIFKKKSTISVHTCNITRTCIKSLKFHHFLNKDSRLRYPNTSRYIWRWFRENLSLKRRWAAKKILQPIFRVASSNPPDCGEDNFSPTPLGAL